jgi:glycosyltransferase involved in cell wall biosynthesis
MKLALIRRQFTATGGAELYLQRLMEALAGAGHELHLFAEDWGQPPRGVAVHRVNVGGSRATRPGRFAAAVAAELAPQRFDCVFSLERTLRQDVYRAGDGVHRVWLQRRRQFAPWWRRPFVGLGAFHRNMLRLEAQTFDPHHTRHVIANSEMVKREIIQHFRFPAERIDVVRNGVDVVRFQRGRRTETRARLGIKSHEFALVFVGSGWERKGLPFLLRALRRLQPGGWSTRFWSNLRDGLVLGSELERVLGREPEGRFLKASGLEAAQRLTLTRIVTALYGGQPARVLEAREAWRAFATSVKLLVVGKGRKPPLCPANVIFAGPMAEVENAYAAADLFVLLPIYEPSANVVFEALAAGLPVVTSALNGAGELIEERVNGTVIDNPADTGRVVEAIAYWWLRRFRVPPVRAAQLSLDRNVAETLAILEKAASEKRGIF